MSKNGHSNEARNGNFLFIIGDNRELMMNVQESNVVENTLNATVWGTREKQLRIPSDKIEQSPLVISIILSEDYRELMQMFQWQMDCRNVDSAHLSKTKPCELIALDSNNQPCASFYYGDAWPSVLGGVVHTIVSEQKEVMVFDATLYFNTFAMRDNNGNEYGER